MNKKQQAKILLEALDEYIQVDFNFEEVYVKSLIKGLVTIEKTKKDQLGSGPNRSQSKLRYKEYTTGKGYISNENY